MTKSLSLMLLLLLPFLAVQAKETGEFTLPKIQVIPIKDTRADKQYELYIKLPEGYEKHQDKTYPVLYFTDAIWHVELLSASTEFLMEEVILVGISWQKDISEASKKEHGAHASRYRDYSITKSSDPDRQAKYQFGQAGNHLAFIRNDVIKHIEKNYRTKPDSRSYFGYSAGGLFGAYILMTQPDTFKNYILGSPSLWRDIPLLTELGDKAGLKHKNLNANVFISYGTLEKELGEHIREFTRLLKNKNDNSLSVNQPVIEGSHQTAFPMTGVRSMTWLSKLTKQEAE
mgnify:CR=1 FL=1